MKKVLLLPLSIALSMVAGCVPEAGSECINGACADKKCEQEKCSRKLPVEVTREEQYTVYKDVEKDCVVETKVPVVKKVPVKTWKYIQRWVDTEVQEPYYVTEKVRVEAEVPVEEEYLVYEKVAKEYEGTVDCPKTIVTKDCECTTVKGKRTITECDKCGNTRKIKVDSEWQVPVQKITSTVETAKCPVTKTKMVDVPVMKNRTVMRDGFVTKEVQVKKWRTVPGKKLVNTRVCETIMKDETTYEIQKKTVKRTVRVPEVKTRTVTDTVIKDVVVDCRTGERINDANGDDKNAAKAKLPAENKTKAEEKVSESKTGSEKSMQG